jgi:hypothetical protein
MIPNWDRKRPIPKRLPEGMIDALKILKDSKDKLDCLKHAFEIISGRYRGGRLKTYFALPALYETDIEKLWNTKGFLHCTHQNYLLRLLLVKSGFFKDDDVILEKTLTYHFSPHQYLRVRIYDSIWICVDPWASHFGIRTGDYAHGFNFEYSYYKKSKKNQ